MIKGLFETYLFVANIEHPIAFYGKAMELKQCHSEEERPAVFFWIGEDKKAKRGLWEKSKDELDTRLGPCNLNLF